MATKTLYVTNVTAASPNFFSLLQDGGSVTGVITSYGFQPGTTGSSATPFYRGRLGATAGNTSALASSYINGSSGPLKGTGTGAATAGDSFIAGPYSGTFTGASWNCAWIMRAATIGATGKLRMRVWASSNSDGTNARELTSGAVESGVITLNALLTNFDATISWLPGAITLNNEYIFFQKEWQETVDGTSAASNVRYWVSSSIVTTPNFTPSAKGVYAMDGSLNVTNIDGISAARGLYSSSGAINVSLAGQSGAYHTSGAWNLTQGISARNVIRAPNGSQYYSTAPNYIDGTLKVTFV